MGDEYLIVRSALLLERLGKPVPEDDRECLEAMADHVRGVLDADTGRNYAIRVALEGQLSELRGAIGRLAQAEHSA